MCPPVSPLRIISLAASLFALGACEGGDKDASTDVVDADGDGFPAGEDCDDGDATVSPGADERAYDGVDNDCDLATPDDDLDGDAYGLDEDCNDGDSAINPGVDELCDGLDSDCDGRGDDEDAVDASTWYLDRDGDGYGDSDAPVVACELPDGAVDNPDDCDDTAASVSPSAPELCDERQNDCDGDWSADDEAGVASFIDSNGTWTALTLTAETPITRDGTLYLCEGEYLGASLVIADDLAVALVGRVGSAGTVLDAELAGSVVTVGSGVTLTVTGLTLTGGGAERGGGIDAEGAGELTLDDVVVSENVAIDYGGGIYVGAEETVSMTGVTISSNQQTYAPDDPTSDSYGGGGVYLETDLEVNITESAFTGNSGEAYGGGATFGGPVTLDDVTFSANDAVQAGGAIYFAGANPVTLNNLNCEYNTSTYGGAIYASNSVIVATGGTLAHNEASGIGGAMYMDDANVTWTDLSAHDNAAEYGGAIGAGEFSPSVLSIQSSVVEDNTASAYGGGIYDRDGSLTLSDGTILRQNSAGWGGGMSVGVYLALEMTDVTVTDNSASHQGGGVFLPSASGASSCTGDGAGSASIDGNTAVGYGQDLYVSFAGGGWAASDCNSTDLYHEDASVEYTTLGSTYTCDEAGCR